MQLSCCSSNGEAARQKKHWQVEVKARRQASDNSEPESLITMLASGIKVETSDKM